MAYDDIWMSQIERYRQMSPAERIELALRLHKWPARSPVSAFVSNIHTLPTQVEEMLRERRRLAYRLSAPRSR